MFPAVKVRHGVHGMSDDSTVAAQHQATYWNFVWPQVSRQAEGAEKIIMFLLLCPLCISIPLRQMVSGLGDVVF
jgi:hypothetical protein